MATLLDILTNAALFMGKTYADLTISGQNIGLFSVNQAKRRAGLLHDFEFSRKLVDIDVNGVTGGSLASAVLHSDGTTPVEIKSIIEVGMFDEDGNLRPVVWTTVAEGLERQRKDNRWYSGSWGGRDDSRLSPSGASRIEFAGTTAFLWPKDEENNGGEGYELGAEVYAMESDWTSADLTGVATVAGSSTSAINGSYTPQGFYNDHPLFLKIASGYALWSTGSAWRISAIADLGGSPTDYYALASSAQSPAGSYSNNGSFAGTVTVADGTATTDTWVKFGSEFLFWRTIEILNHRFKWLVPRTEGNLPPPKQLADEALSAFIDWDNNMYEQFRRHSR